MFKRNILPITVYDLAVLDDSTEGMNILQGLKVL
jgi:hypothetical protein